MIMLSKKVRMFITGKYRTTKVRPVCKDYDLKMHFPKGNEEYYNHRLKNVGKIYTGFQTENIVRGCSRVIISRR